MTTGPARIHEATAVAGETTTMTTPATGPGTGMECTALSSAPRVQTAVSPYTQDLLRRIAASGRTPFEQRVWSLLCQIPAGHVTTYALMAKHLGSSPRAVGNALRRNPFAPMVPCHRCVATGGGLGGFKGVSGPGVGKRRGNGSVRIKRHDGTFTRMDMEHEEGITLAEKRALLRMEGVRFDDRGRVLGTPFRAFR
ncbi:methylated-DNA-protein-cysteine methyltransferase [Niveomyces insectorum RCEF 264]|uniref:Methylated-DNA--protein-cysteine methyltransferase n=1 Tax=Niveomyces insectorum RCEF 264 TaxID=1081102 RepID=A0A167TSZ8_9HYPO|nr:methylated-DNA-protein-cysteine methyltransferase [Niveomyces insectorum RCEF 264]